jgi:tight adherence protein B
MILFFAFVAILSITFGVMAFVTKPSEGQVAIEKRITELGSARTEAGIEAPDPGILLKTEKESRFGWLDALLERYKLTEMLDTIILQADAKTTATKVLLSCGGCALLGFLLTYFFVPILLVQVVVSLGLGYLPFGIVSFKRSRRIAAFNNALPDAIDMMGRALRAGHSMIASISIVAEQSVEPVRSEFSEVFKQQNFGVPLRDALTQMLDHVPSQDLRVLVTGILVQKETGGNLAEILDRTVAVIRERIRIQGEIRTHTAQGRMTGWILCTLPIVMLFVINLVNPGYSKVLLDTELGHKLIYVGLFLLTTGGLIIRAIVNGIEV